MTFLTKFMFINLNEIILKTVERKYLNTLYHPKILAYVVYLAPQIDPILTIFHQKLPILTKLTSLIIFLTKVELINLTEVAYNDIKGLLFQKKKCNAIFDLSLSHCGGYNIPPCCEKSQFLKFTKYKVVIHHSKYIFL